MNEDGGVTARWPIGPRYTELVQAEEARAWALYKLRSADWFIDRLEEVGQKVGFDRYIGVEMAMDGALAALCGAFDASTAAVIRTVERYEEQAVRDRRSAASPSCVLPYHYSWYGSKRNKQTTPGAKDKLTQIASEVHDINVNVLIDAVDSALQRRTPVGWLTRLQRLRNTAIHQDTLARYIEYGNGGENLGVTWSLTVDGKPEHPVLYLRNASHNLSDLTGQLLEVCEYLCPNGIPTPRPA